MLIFKGKDMNIVLLFGGSIHANMVASSCMRGGHILFFGLMMGGA